MSYTNEQNNTAKVAQLIKNSIHYTSNNTCYFNGKKNSETKIYISENGKTKILKYEFARWNCLCEECDDYKHLFIKEPLKHNFDCRCEECSTHIRPKVITICHSYILEEIESCQTEIKNSNMWNFKFVQNDIPDWALLSL